MKYGRRQDDLLAWAHQRGERGREAVIGTRRDDQVLEPALDAGVLTETLGERASQRRAAGVGRIRVHVRREQRRFGGAKRRRGRGKKGSACPSEMTRCPLARSAAARTFSGSNGGSSMSSTRGGMRTSKDITRVV